MHQHTETRITEHSCVINIKIKFSLIFCLSALILVCDFGLVLAEYAKERSVNYNDLVAATLSQDEGGNKECGAHLEEQFCFNELYGFRTTTVIFCTL